MPVHLQDKRIIRSGKAGTRGRLPLCHDYPKHYVQQYLPEGMRNRIYEPSDNGYEKQINAHMKWLKADFLKFNFTIPDIRI